MTYEFFFNHYRKKLKILMIVGKKDGFYEYINRQGEKFDKKKK